MGNPILMMPFRTMEPNGQIMMVMVLETTLLVRLTTTVLMFGALHGRIPLVAQISMQMVGQILLMISSINHPSGMIPMGMVLEIIGESIPGTLLD